MEKRIFLLLLVILFGNLTFTAVDGVSVRVPICALRSVKDYILGFRNQSCPVYGDQLAERPHFIAVTQVTSG